MSSPDLVPLHFGHLPLWQQALVMLVAFGPFLILGVVVFVVRRQDLAEEETEKEAGHSREAHERDERG